MAFVVWLKITSWPFGSKVPLVRVRLQGLKASTSWKVAAPLKVIVELLENCTPLLVIVFVPDVPRKKIPAPQPLPCVTKAHVAIDRLP